MLEHLSILAQLLENLATGRACVFFLLFFRRMVKARTSESWEHFHLISSPCYSPGRSRRCHRGCGRRNDRGGKCEVVKLEVSFCRLHRSSSPVFHGEFRAAFVRIMFHSRGMLKRIPSLNRTMRKHVSLQLIVKTDTVGHQM